MLQSQPDRQQLISMRGASCCPKETPSSAPGLGISSSPSHKAPPLATSPWLRLQSHATPESRHLTRAGRCGAAGWRGGGAVLQVGVQRVETHAGCFLESPGGPCCPHSHREMNPDPDSSPPCQPTLPRSLLSSRHPNTPSPHDSHPSHGTLTPGSHVSHPLTHIPLMTHSFLYHVTP